MLGHIKEKLGLLQFVPSVGLPELARKFLCRDSGLFVIQFLIIPSTCEVS